MLNFQWHDLSPWISLKVVSAPKPFNSCSLLNAFNLASFFSCSSFNFISSSSFFFFSSSSKAFLSFFGSGFFTSGFFSCFLSPGFFFFPPSPSSAIPNAFSTSTFIFSSNKLLLFPSISVSFSNWFIPSDNLIPSSFSISSYEYGPYSLMALSYLITQVIYFFGDSVNTLGIIVKPLIHFGGSMNSQSYSLNSFSLYIVNLISSVSSTGKAWKHIFLGLIAISGLINSIWYLILIFCVVNSSVITRQNISPSRWPTNPSFDSYMISTNLFSFDNKLSIFVITLNSLGNMIKPYFIGRWLMFWRDMPTLVDSSKFLFP